MAPLVFLLAGFIVSRPMYWHEGVFFDIRMLGQDWAIHFIEPQLLRERLLESVYFLHSQPPLFNLFLGGMLHAFGTGTADAFAWTYTGMGLLLALCLYGVLVRLTVPRWPSALLTLLFMASPATVLYENWLFYTYPEALLLCASALFFHRFAASRRAVWAWIFFALLGLLALSRSTFHLVWYLAMVGLVLATVAQAPRRTVVLAAVGPLLLIVALYAKNAFYFGTFSASSWLGMNFSRVTLEPTPLAERQALVREGTLPPLALAKSFLPLSDYPPEYRRVSGPDVPVLRRERKLNGGPNFNHEGYIPLSRDFARASFALVRARPGLYLHHVGRAFRLFFAPASDYPFLASNREQVPGLSEFFNVSLLGMYGASAPELRGQWISEEEISERTLWNWVGVFVFGLVAVGGLTWRERRSTGGLSPESATRLFLAGNILYVTLLSNLIEYLENNRMRYPIDPLVLALGATAVVECLRRLRSRLKE